VIPKISVIIPVYNSARYFQECLRSVLGQSLCDIEIIIVDDGSTDSEIPQILDDFAKKDLRIRVIYKKNEGVSAARNDGLSIAKGDYVLFVDSDDFLFPKALEVSYSEAIRTNADVVMTDHSIWKNSIPEKEQHFFSTDFVTESRNTIVQLQQMVLYKGYSPFPDESCSYMFSTVWSKLIRRQLLVDHDIRFNPQLHLYEDGLFVLQVLQVAKIVSFKRILTYHYRVLENSLCHINENHLIQDSKDLLTAVKIFLKDNPDLHMAYLARALFQTKKMALRSFFCKESEGSFVKRFRDFRTLFSQEPYREAVGAIPRLKLSGNEKKYGKMLQMHLSLVVALLYEIRAKLR